VTLDVLSPLSIPSPDPSWQVFNVGQWLRDIGLKWFPFDLNVHAYAVCILIGIIAATIMTSRRLTKRGAEPGVALDIIIWAVPFGIVGARIFHVLTHPDDYFGAGKDLMHVLYIWEGGLAIFGGLIGGLIGAIIGCRITGIRLASFADALAPALLLAQAFGRFGNWFNHELFGIPTDWPWGLQIESTNPAYPVGLPTGTLFQPTFLYEIIWNLIGVAVILFVERTYRLQQRKIFDVTVPWLVPGVLRLQWGKAIGLYLIWYGAGRIVWENIRIDPSEIFFGLRTNVWAAIGAVVLGLIIIIAQSRRHTGLEPSPYVAGREWVKGEPGVDSGETYSDDDEPGNDAPATSTSLSTRAPATSASPSKTEMAKKS
jgi:prolipoprotein diacylglyceryl transferase